VRAVVAPRARYCALGQCLVPQRFEMDLCSGGSREIMAVSNCCTQGKYPSRLVPRVVVLTLAHSWYRTNITVCP